MLANNTLDAQDHNIKFNVDPDDMSAYGIYVNGAATINDLSSFTAADNTPLFDVIHIADYVGDVLLTAAS